MTSSSRRQETFYNAPTDAKDDKPKNSQIPMEVSGGGYGAVGGGAANGGGGNGIGGDGLGRMGDRPDKVDKVRSTVEVEPVGGSGGAFGGVGGGGAPMGEASTGDGGADTGGDVERLRVHNSSGKLVSPMFVQAFSGRRDE